MTSSSALRTPRTLIPLLLFLLSGAAALVYEVLWLKELSLLFGATAYAAATTLAVFFLGLSAGGFLWGKWAARSANPLRTYAALELGIALTALLYFLIADAYVLVYAPLYRAVGHQPALFLLVKLLLASGLLFLPAFFMGGTFPVMGQHLIRQAQDLGKKGSLLYGLNVIGGALGALAAGFYLPLHLGFRASYLLAVAANAAIALTALLISRPAAPQAAAAVPAPAPEAKIEPPPERRVWLFALLSGVLTLGLEVLWTRMFAQVLNNSVYSFSAILITFLAALALGSLLAHVLCRLELRPAVVLPALLLLAGVAVGLSPRLFFDLTNGMLPLAAPSWSGYVASVFGHAAAVILLPGVLAGSVFPYLLKMSHGLGSSTGQIIGRLTAINTVGAIAGSLAAGFLLLPLAGLWASLEWVAVAYLAAAVFAPGRRSHRALAVAAVPALGLGLLLVLAPPQYPMVTLAPHQSATVEQVWEGANGTVAVVREGRELNIKLNNYYNVGGTGRLERWQSWIPLFLHPAPKSVFFLGMGTGITAGAALDFPLERMVVSELIPEIEVAARKYFTPYTQGLFADPRVEILIADGRNHLLATAETYDLVIADLFIPWHEGTGALYAREHFEAAASRLAEGGLFVQWVPLYQVSRREFSIIARTMLEVFPQVTAWREHFATERSILALVGQREMSPLPTAHLRRNVATVLRGAASRGAADLDVLPYTLFAGNLTANAGLFADAAVNTDDRPVIEYLAPITTEQRGGSGRPWLSHFRLEQLLVELFAGAPPENDPYLGNLTPRQVGFVRAGLLLYQVRLYMAAGRTEEARSTYRTFLELIPGFDLHPELRAD